MEGRGREGGTRGGDRLICEDSYVVKGAALAAEKPPEKHNFPSWRVSDWYFEAAAHSAEVMGRFTSSADWRRAVPTPEETCSRRPGALLFFFFFFFNRSFRPLPSHLRQRRPAVAANAAALVNDIMMVVITAICTRVTHSPSPIVLWSNLIQPRFQLPPWACDDWHSVAFSMVRHRRRSGPDGARLTLIWTNWTHKNTGKRKHTEKSPLCCNIEEESQAGCFLFQVILTYFNIRDATIRVYFFSPHSNAGNWSFQGLIFKSDPITECNCFSVCGSTRLSITLCSTFWNPTWQMSLHEFNELIDCLSLRRSTLIWWQIYS